MSLFTTNRPPRRHHGAGRASVFAAAVAALTLLSLPARPALGHWISPEQIIGGLRNNPQLRDSVGVFEVQRNKRILIIRVIPATWQGVPAADRLHLAAEWWETWRHNVKEGVVAVVDARDDTSLVNFDGEGQPSLIQARP